MGQLGLGDTAPVSQITPTPVTFFEKNSLRVTQLAVFVDHTAARTHDGAVWVWGRGTDYQLGTGQRNTSSVPITPTDLPLYVHGVACSPGCTFAFGIDKV